MVAKREGEPNYNALYTKLRPGGPRVSAKTARKVYRDLAQQTCGREASDLTGSDVGNFRDFVNKHKLNGGTGILTQESR